MKFLKLPRFERTWTRKMETAYLNKCKREIISLPLFAEEVSETHLSVEQVKGLREREWEKSEREDRQDHALAWVKARRRLRVLPDEVKSMALKKYNSEWKPKVPWYLEDAITQAERIFENGGEIPRLVRLRPKAPDQISIF